MFKFKFLKHHKMSHQKVFLVIFTLVSLSSSQETKKNNLENDINAYAEMASDFLKNQNVDNIGGLINNFVQTEGGKQIGDMLMNMGSNKNANQILQSLGSLIAQNGKSGGGFGQGFDPAILGNVLSVLGSADQKGGGNSGDDSPDIISMFGGLLGQQGGLDNLMNFMPMVLSTINAFTGDEAQKRVDDHSGHAWFLPPILEKIHIAVDHFMNSEMGQSLLRNIGSEKIVKVFTDGDGKFRFTKFVELLENHSFRKHWIHLVTKRIAVIISYFADPTTQKRFLTTVQYFANSFLKSQGFPKTAMFDPTRPSETISAFINFFFKKYLGYKTNAKQYVKPAVEYIHEVLNLAQKKGFFTGRGIDSAELSHKLTDTINLEVIEPVARVYRAYRFAKKHPECDRYVMCLVNEQSPQDVPSLPGLKTGLSKATSLFASWFLSGHTGTSFWSLYYIITEENNCKSRFVDTCNDFHVEEVRVTTEYVHNEL